MPAGNRDLLARAVDALRADDLRHVVDLVAHLDPDEPDVVVVANADGAVRLHPDGTHEVVEGRDPVAWTDPLAFLPYEREVADPGPPNERNSYPDPHRRLLSALSDPERSPDVAVVHTPRHSFPDEGGHAGEHGSLDVIQSRAPLLLSGPGVVRAAPLHESARVVDVAPTLLRMAGVGAQHHRDAAGRELDGRALDHLVEPGAGRRVIGLLWDGAHCGELLRMAEAGELPGVARLLSGGTALRGGAVAEFPSVTLCNHTSALTGVGPGRHGVMGNVYYDRTSGQRVVPNDASTWHRSAEWMRPGTATVFEQLSASRPGASTACVDEAVDRGATTSTMQQVRAAHAAGQVGSGGLDAHLPPAEGSRFVGDEAHLADPYFRWATRVDEAGLAQVLQLHADPASAPDLTWWATVVTDAGHHAGGPRSAIATASLRDADRRLQAFLDHLDRTGAAEDVVWLLTADHGFEAADPSVTGSWRPALERALAGERWRDEGPGALYLG